MNILKNVCYILLFLMFSACSESAVVEKNPVIENFKWDELVDAEMSHWDTYLSFKHQVDYDGSPPKDVNGKLIEPIGMNKAGYDVFTTLKENNEDIIRVGGPYYGCLISKKEYKNYHFQLKFKWGDKKWIPRKNKLKDSGILYHSIGEPGVEHWRSWMLSQEFQIMEGHTGDFWRQASSAIDIRAYAPESLLNCMAHESQDYLPFGEGEDAQIYCLRSNNFEKAHGEWNTLDLICHEGKSLHIVNGEVVMILKNSRYLNDNNEMVPLIKGKIQLQSEAAELFYKDIKIRELDTLSSEHAALF